MAELNRRPGSPGEDPKPTPDGDRGGQPDRRTRPDERQGDGRSDRRTRPDAGQGGDQGGGRTDERSWVRGARRPVPHEAPSRVGVSRRPADGSGARPRWSRVRPVPRDDRAASDTPPRTVRSDDRSAELTGLRERSDSDRRDLARLQADDPDHTGDRPTTADANGPGTPDEPGPPAPPDHPDDPEPERPDQPTALDAANAEIADLRKQLADEKAANAERDAKLDAANAKNAELETQIEAVKAEADAKLDSVKAEHAAELDAVRAESAAQMDAAKAEIDAKMTALESRFAAAIGDPQAKVDERADGIDRERPEDLARRRAVELQDQLPDGARGRVTMAVGVTEAAGGEQTTVIGTSEPRGYLRPGVTLNEGEVVAAGRGHAEADIVHWAEQREQKVLTVGAGRPICAPCAEEIQRVDAVAATPLKEEK